MTPDGRPVVPASVVTQQGGVISLRDHRRVLVRPVQRGDGDALSTAFLRLSPESQQLRFGSAPRALGLAALRHLVDTVDGVDHVAFAAFAEDEPARLVGVARVLRYPHEPDTLDVGVTVADDYQGSGLGRAFCQLLAAYRPRPARRIQTQVEPGNVRAMALLAAFGEPHIRSAEGDLVIELDD